MTINADLLNAIKARGETQTEFNYGILTADRYVKTLQECVGTDLCYRYASKGNTSYADLVKAASKKLTYNNPDMRVEEIYLDYKARFSENGLDLELPKNTLMVFRHVLTTPRKDRDGDILRTKGARVDPKMLMLWQHVHTLPIGKQLGIAQHTSKILELYSAIVDINELAHDAAVMIDNGMGRFSHGFRALDFTKIKEESGKPTGGGFDVKEYEIMEESLVSVPSNVDAETIDIMMSLVEGGKLTHPIMKSYGSSLRDKMPKQKQSGIEFDASGAVVDSEGKDEERSEKGAGKEGCTCGGSAGASEKADDDSEKGDGKAKDEKMTCPKCGGKIEGGKCSKCGMVLKDDNADDEDKGYAGDEQEDDGGMKCPKCGTVLDYSGTCQKCGYIRESGKRNYELIRKEIIEDIKAGRVISKANYSKLKEISEDLKEVGEHCSTRSGKALCAKCSKGLDDIIKGAGYDGEDPKEFAPPTQKAPTVKDAMAIMLVQATPEERKNLMMSLQALEAIDEQEKRTQSYLKTLRG